MIKKVFTRAKLLTSYGTLEAGTTGYTMVIPQILKPIQGESFFHPDHWEENIYIRLAEKDYEPYNEELKISV